MSLEKVRATLLGYEQVFPKGLDTLNEASDESYISNGSDLETDLGRHIEGFLKMGRPTTEDGYCWFWGLKFEAEKGLVNVLFPWAQDWDKNDGSPKDRSISIYKKGEVSMNDVDVLMNHINERYVDCAAEYKAVLVREEEAQKKLAAQQKNNVDAPRKTH